MEDALKKAADSVKEHLHGKSQTTTVEASSADASEETTTTVESEKDTWDAENKHEEWYLDSEDEYGRLHMNGDLKLPEQGYHGQPVKHVDQSTFTGDWHKEHSSSLRKICAEHPNSKWCAGWKKVAPDSFQPDSFPDGNHSNHSNDGLPDGLPDVDEAVGDDVEVPQIPWKKHLRPFSGTTGTTASACVALLVLMAGVTLS